MGWVTRISPYYYDLLLTLKGQRSRSSTWSSWKCWNTVVFFMSVSLPKLAQSTLTTDQNILQQSPDCSILGLVCHAMQCRFSCTVFSFIVHTAVCPFRYSQSAGGTSRLRVRGRGTSACWSLRRRLQTFDVDETESFISGHRSSYPAVSRRQHHSIAIWRRRRWRRFCFRSW